MTEYAAGTPSWFELSTTDPEGSHDFYSRLFGWTATEGAEQFGGYRTFMDGDRGVGGLNPMGEHNAWNTYVATDDAGAKQGKRPGLVLLERAALRSRARQAFLRSRVRLARRGPADGPGGLH